MACDALRQPIDEVTPLKDKEMINIIGQAQDQGKTKGSPQRRSDDFHSYRILQVIQVKISVIQWYSRPPIRF